MKSQGKESGEKFIVASSADLFSALYSLPRSEKNKTPQSLDRGVVSTISKFDFWKRNEPALRSGRGVKRMMMV